LLAVLRGKRAKELVEDPVIAIEDQHVSVAVRLGAALDRGVGGNGIRAGVAFVLVLKLDRDLRLLARHDDVRNAPGLAVERRAEVGVKLFRFADARDQGIRIRVHRLIGDVLVPRIVRRQQDLPVKTGVGAQIGLVRCLRLGPQRECERNDRREYDPSRSRGPAFASDKVHGLNCRLAAGQFNPV
jgi:hypothetical protein